MYKKLCFKKEYQNIDTLFAMPPILTKGEKSIFRRKTVLFIKPLGSADSTCFQVCTLSVLYV